MASPAKTNRFDIGEMIVHHYYGVGKVEAIVNKGVEGNKQQFYRVSTPKMDYWLPIEEEDTDNVEPIRSKADFESSLKILSQAPETIAEHHKSRKKVIHERWQDGSLTSRARLMRDLNGRLKLVKLSFNEKEMLEKVRRAYINEWLVADGDLKRPQAQAQIREALAKGIKKAKKAQE